MGRRSSGSRLRAERFSRFAAFSSRLRNFSCRFSWTALTASTVLATTSSMETPGGSSGSGSDSGSGAG